MQCCWHGISDVSTRRWRHSCHPTCAEGSERLNPKSSPICGNASRKILTEGGSPVNKKMHGKREFGGKKARVRANKKMHMTHTARRSFRHNCPLLRFSGFVYFLLPVRARFGPVILGVSKLRCVKSVHEEHLFEVFVEHASPVSSRSFRNNTTIMGSKTRPILPKMAAIGAFHVQFFTKCFQFA